MIEDDVEFAAHRKHLMELLKKSDLSHGGYVFNPLTDFWVKGDDEIAQEAVRSLTAAQLRRLITSTELFGKGE